MISKTNFYGYQGRWAWVDLTQQRVRIEEPPLEYYKNFIGGRGVQAALIHDLIKKKGPLEDPLSPLNRIIIGNSSLNDTFIPTAGRGSCSFISPMTRSPQAIPGLQDHHPVWGLITHSSCGGHFPNRLKRAGFDQIIIDGRADQPVRLLVCEGQVTIVKAEEELFEIKGGQKVPRPTSAIISFLNRKYPGSSSVCLGPAGWNLIPYANLVLDYHRNFGRGGGGAVFGSKNLVAITAWGKQPVKIFDEEQFSKLTKKIDQQVEEAVADPNQTVSFRPQTGTTWWLDRAFRGDYLGQVGGYLPWHNYDEGYFDPSKYEQVSTRAFLNISGKHQVCHRCRHVFCTRQAKVAQGEFKGEGVRPEFETIALWINCCLMDREAIFYLNKRANDLGVDTMSWGSLTATAMELTEKGFLVDDQGSLRFGDPREMLLFLEGITYQSSPLGELFGRYPDAVILELIASQPRSYHQDIIYCFTQTYGGLGYAGIEPKVFPGMFTAYGTSNRGRGDHTYAWTIQAEEAGLKEPEELAAYVLQAQRGKAMIDSLGLCDFFPVDIFQAEFISLYHALTGIAYDEASWRACGQRIFNLERKINNYQGRKRSYDAFIPAKLLVPLKNGPQAGKAVRPLLYHRILDHYYQLQGWTDQGEAPKVLFEF